MKAFSSHTQFVSWFRHASPYIHAHHGKTFVLSFEGIAVSSTRFRHLIHDIALLSSLGIRLVLVHGTRQRIKQNLEERGVTQQYANGMRITDDTSLEQVKAACGQITADILALLSMGMTDSPEIYANIRIVSGNFITARPLGIRSGVDFMHTGEVRRVEANAIQQQLDNGCIVLISPLGYSPTGEIFNLSVEDVSTSVAITLKADKWVSLNELEQAISDNDHLTLQETRELLKNASDADTFRILRGAAHACEQGVNRVHLVQRNIDGGLLMELFSRDGVGTMISADPYEHLRQATIDDVGSILNLIAPLEEEGVLVKRSREKLEMEIGRFVVQERDGTIIACAALYPYPEEHMAELACVAVHPDYKGKQRGDALLGFMEKQARKNHIHRLFILTTRTAQWFQQRGFTQAKLDKLPITRLNLYNYQRLSKIFIKDL
ncbi:amino-acid N-acetyltransferase [Candidatus Venteria ishoeyi]|uniref:Amino-acid acetyltransferase n=1 Tax=Candidatus Venteria ishoeyi TaxID=1899563 RepID=A0A1H6F7Q3_9GAMM|nr:amino-acid N-acetyltransferase [Candidatus Venteria ishoeyi]MDM8547621.1 amino-acid N-acetyltransferase [Candidatus Venteria ishoeyi]SEH06150.1 Amino-acid acetyltransferase [Candidatus Venteria ishoeyi]